MLPSRIEPSTEVSRTPSGVAFEDWMSLQHKGLKSHAHLIRILIPNKDRLSCLRSLNKMNINYLTLFPDLHGASQNANMHLSGPKY